MAYTEIHKITATLNAALDYITRDKVEDISEDKVQRVLELEDVPAGKSLNDSMKDSIDYAMNDKEGTLTFKTYTSFNSCFPMEGQTFEKFILDHAAFWSKAKEKDKNRKTTKDNKEVIGWHLIQSFEESIRPEIANEIGRKLVERIIPDFPCQISTHTNTDHTHNHIILSAWDMDGKKFHNDHKAVDLIRRVSDELCKEYGLHVLEDTREMKLVKYKDADGQTHYYEPTDRKNELINKRESGDISRDDVNSYRNTFQYDDNEANKETVRIVVKRDIDFWLPQVSSFDSLLQRLREQGYSIRDKKKNGEWLEYITYKPPIAKRGVRDNSLSDDGFYRRSNLEKTIQERSNNKSVPTNAGLKYFDEYIVGEFDPYRDIDEHTRLERDDQNGTYAKRRSIVETEIIRDIRKQYSENGIKDYKHLHKSNGALTAREKQLHEIIQFRCKCLRFIEKKDIKTFNAIQERISKTTDQLQRMNAAIETLKVAIDKEKGLLNLPDEIESLSYKIAANKNNEGYMSTEYFEDVKVINELKKRLQAKGLVTPEKLQEQRKKIAAAEAKLRRFESKADLMNREMETYGYFNEYVKVLGEEYEMKKEEGKSTDENQRNVPKQIL